MTEFEKIYAEYFPDVYKYVLSLCHHEAMAEDITQEVLLKYMMNKKPFKDEEHRKNWIIRVTVHLCINLNKSAWKRKTVSLFDQTLDLQTEEQYKMIYDLDCLSEKYRIVVQLHYYEDLSIEQISKILKISESNVKTRLNRARNELKKDIEKGEVSYGKI